MRWTSISAIYFVTWFLVLFGVLPFGVRTQGDAGETVLGTPASAPVKPPFLRVVIMTTLVTTILVAAYYYLYVVQGYDTDWLARHFGVTRGQG